MSSNENDEEVVPLHVVAEKYESIQQDFQMMGSAINSLAEEERFYMQKLQQIQDACLKNGLNDPHTAHIVRLLLAPPQCPPATGDFGEAKSKFFLNCHESKNSSQKEENSKSKLVPNPGKEDPNVGQVPENRLKFW
ncbi:uncharacterized protein LOC119662123 [Teleopsis dalmanni]|uniref:uncharacterized protein LOC119662123 n=1 Tax=Teleopsis dalmanni TaxID=139649 RepID=UPI0018CD2592|nr:uncharacterized protein LOC119662123 [Teleopsis dalmanni]